MSALQDGSGSRTARLVVGAPPKDNSPFFVWGQDWLAMKIIPDAYKNKRPFWHIDNGFYLPAKGRSIGYYRFSYRGMTPILLNKPPTVRSYELMPTFHKWRDKGDHVLIAMPGEFFGRAIGLDMRQWSSKIEKEVRQHTDRPIIVRWKNDVKPISHHLKNAWALVTHSSNAAVDAVIAGIPVFVAETSAAAPIGNLDLSKIEEPVMPKRRIWWHSIMCQQFTIDEMRSGVAQNYFKMIAKQTDGG